MAYSSELWSNSRNPRTTQPQPAQSAKRRDGNMGTCREIRCSRSDYRQGFGTLSSRERGRVYELRTQVWPFTERAGKAQSGAQRRNQVRSPDLDT